MPESNEEVDSNDNVFPIISTSDGMKMQENNLKDELFTRRLPVSGFNAVLIECLSAASDDDAYIEDASKTQTLLSVSRASNNASNNDRRYAQ